METDVQWIELSENNFLGSLDGSTHTGAFVQRVARHWRVCRYASGPALEVNDNADPAIFRMREEAMDWAGDWLKQVDAERRLEKSR